MKVHRLSSEAQTRIMPRSKEDELQHLKSHLGITPKTANMLHASGYATPMSLRNSTPNEVAAKFAALAGMDAKKAKDYVRPLRRITMLGDIEDADKAAAVVKNCKNWSNKDLTEIGAYEGGFNGLTGVEIRRKMEEAGALP